MYKVVDRVVNAFNYVSGFLYGLKDGVKIYNSHRFKNYECGANADMRYHSIQGTFFKDRLFEFTERQDIPRNRGEADGRKVILGC